MRLLSVGGRQLLKTPKWKHGLIMEMNYSDKEGLDFSSRSTNKKEKTANETQKLNENIERQLEVDPEVPV